MSIGPAVEVVRLLVLLSPINLDDVPDIEEDFSDATAFVLVTIFEEQFEIRGC